MSWPLSDDVEAVIDRLTPPMSPAKHWWAFPLSVLFVIGVPIGIAAIKADRAHVPVHKTGPDRTPTTVVTP